MAQNPPFGTTGTISLATGTQTNNTTGAVPLPGFTQGGRLRGLIVDVQTPFPGGPFAVHAGILFGQTNSLVTLVQGWVRGDANNGGSDCVHWEGDMPLGREPCKIVIYWRNDSGATASLAYGIIVELS